MRALSYFAEILRAGASEIAGITSSEPLLPSTTPNGHHANGQSDSSAHSLSGDDNGNTNLTPEGVNIDTRGVVGQLPVQVRAELQRTIVGSDAEKTHDDQVESKSGGVGDLETGGGKFEEEERKEDNGSALMASTPLSAGLENSDYGTAQSNDEDEFRQNKGCTKKQKRVGVGVGLVGLGCAAITYACVAFKGGSPLDPTLKVTFTNEFVPEATAGQWYSPRGVEVTCSSNFLLKVEENMTGVYTFNSSCGEYFPCSEAKACLNTSSFYIPKKLGFMNAGDTNVTLTVGAQVVGKPGISAIATRDLEVRGPTPALAPSPSGLAPTPSGLAPTPSGLAPSPSPQPEPSPSPQPEPSPSPQPEPSPSPQSGPSPSPQPEPSPSPQPEPSPSPQPAENCKVEVSSSPLTLSVPVNTVSRVYNILKLLKFTIPNSDTCKLLGPLVLTTELLLYRNGAVVGSTVVDCSKNTIENFDDSQSTVTFTGAGSPSALNDCANNFQTAFFRRLGDKEGTINVSEGDNKVSATVVY